MGGEGATTPTMTRVHSEYLFPLWLCGGCGEQFGCFGVPDGWPHCGRVAGGSVGSEPETKED